MSDKLGDYSKVPSSEHKVFTLMGREGRVAQTWRMVKCNTSPHCPKTMHQWGFVLCRFHGKEKDV